MSRDDHDELELKSLNSIHLDTFSVYWCYTFYYGKAKLQKPRNRFDVFQPSQQDRQHHDHDMTYITSVIGSEVASAHFKQDFEYLGIMSCNFT